MWKICDGIICMQQLFVLPLCGSSLKSGIERLHVGLFGLREQMHTNAAICKNVRVGYKKQQPKQILGLNVHIRCEQRLFVDDSTVWWKNGHPLLTTKHPAPVPVSCSYVASPTQVEPCEVHAGYYKFVPPSIRNCWSPKSAGLKLKSGRKEKHGEHVE